ncbi:hypothetical protein J4Q44_G00340300 [Coregonus suidteri]|uniref:Uncharacterized protein n=1 Tax=Coregonus suidteri TaxID=861788 RepID=A0AAN8QNN6_9TELE
MDYMDSGMRYTPNKGPDRDWDQAVTFLPAADSKKLEKKKGPGRVGAVIGIVIFAAVIALMTGLLVWHFHYRKDTRIRKGNHSTRCLRIPMKTPTALSTEHWPNRSSNS